MFPYARQIKNYYNDITHDNLKLIKNLKDEVNDKKKKAQANQKLMFDISQENKRLKDPLAVAVNEVGHLKYELKDSEKDRLSLRNAKARLVLLEKKFKNLKVEHGHIHEQYEKVEEERNKVYDSFEDTVRSVKKRSDFRNLVLETKMDSMQNQLDKKQSQFNEILSAANLDPGELGRLTQKLDNMLDSRNSLIRQLQYDVTRGSKAYNDTLKTYRSKLLEVFCCCEM